MLLRSGQWQEGEKWRCGKLEGGNEEKQETDAGFVHMNQLLWGCRTETCGQEGWSAKRNGSTELKINALDMKMK